MKKLFCLLLVLTMAIPAFADKIDFGVTGHAPTVTGAYGADEFNRQIKEAFDNVLEEINNQFNEIAFDSPKKFLGAMGNSSVYASHGATTRGYAGYDKFSATIGSTFGVQLPASISSMKNDVGELSDSLKKEGDINLGVGPNLINAQFGLNMGVLKLDKLYLGLRVGYFNLPSLIDDLTYKYLTLGITANYQIIPSISLAGLIAWRGVSIGSGFIYNNSKIGITMPLGDPIDEEIGSGLGRIYMEPKASLNLNVNTFTIPLEAITAIKLLIFNIPFGIGADLAFGNTSLGFGINSDIDLRDLAAGYTQATKGDVSVKAGTSISPTFFNFKIMTGFGFQAKVFVFDIPITFYPANHGYNFGVTIGVVF